MFRASDMRTDAMLVLRNARYERARTKTYPCKSCGECCANYNVKL